MSEIFLMFGGVWLVGGLLFIDAPYWFAKRQLRHLDHGGDPLPREPAEEIR